MPENTCRICGTPLEDKPRTRGRSPVYCSAACRQKAYRSRQEPEDGQAVHRLIAEIERRVRELTPRVPAEFYTEVTDLSSSVGRLRRLAKTARDAVEGLSQAKNVTENATAPDDARSAGEVAGEVTEELRQEIVTPEPVTTEDVTTEDVTTEPVPAENVTRSGETKTWPAEEAPDLEEPDLSDLSDDQDPVAGAVRSGDEWTFAGLVEPFRHELQVHCYRMVGSYDDSEDMVQETFLRAWNRRDGFEGRSSFRSWLYKIATNVCLDFLRRNSRRPQRYEPIPGINSGDGEPPARVTWLQPYPEHLLADLASEDAQPESRVVSRETMELVFITAIQHLPPRQRAVLMLRDVIGWSAADTASQLDMSIASVTSALQRARQAVRRHLPTSRTDWTVSTGPTGQEREILQRYMDAADRADAAAVAELLSEDVVLTMPPNPFWFVGREAMMAFVGTSIDPASPQYLGSWRHLPTMANGQPAAAGYLRRQGTTVYRAQVLDVLRVENSRIAEITSFEPHLFPSFGLPLTL